MAPDLILLIFLLFVLLIISKLFLGRLYTPIGIYCTIWIGGIFLYQLRLIEYEPTYIKSWFFILSSIFVFVIGSITASFPFKKYKFNSMDIFVKYKAYSQNKAYLLIILLSTVALFSEVLKIKILLNDFGSFDVISSHGEEIRNLYVQRELRMKYGILNYFSQFAYPAAILAGFYLSPFSKKKILMLLPLFPIFFTSITSFGRATIFWGILLYLNSYFININLTGKPSIRIRHLILLGILLLGVFVLFNSIFIERIPAGDPIFYTKYASPEFLDIKENLVEDRQPFFLLFGNIISNYHYLATPFASLNKVIGEDMFTVHTYGVQTFASFARALRKIGLNINLLEFIEESKFITHVPVQSVVGTYLTGIYRDFGLIGIIVIPYFLGFISTYLYWNSIVKPNIVSMGLLSFLYTFFMYSWHSSLFYHTAGFITVTVFIVLAAIIKIRFKKNSKMTMS